MTQSKRISNLLRDGKETDQVLYYLSTLHVDVRKCGDGVLGHWSIENFQHWVLDVTSREDDCRIRKDAGPANFARLRRIALNILKQDASKGSVCRKRKRAAWNEAELLIYSQNRDLGCDCPAVKGAWYHGAVSGRWGSFFSGRKSESAAARSDRLVRAHCLAFGMRGKITGCGASVASTEVCERRFAARVGPNSVTHIN